MKPLPKMDGETQCWEHNCEVYVKADDYAALNDYAALVQMERDSARAEVERLKADIRDARELMRGMIDAKDGRVARFLIERAERFIQRTADPTDGSR